MLKGFTLIELLIVIGILSILATTVTLIINPANLLREARDIQRISDLRTIQSAISLYLVRVPDPELFNGTACSQGDSDPNHVWFATADQVSGDSTYRLNATRQPFQNHPGTGGAGITSANLGDPTTEDMAQKIRLINGPGWIPIDFTALASFGISSPLAKLPVDPINDGTSGSLGNTGYYYAYQCAGLSYEINANMESVKYSNGGEKDVESTDGGTVGCYGGAAGRCDTPPSTTKASNIYEVGNDPGLDL